MKEKLMKRLFILFVIIMVIVAIVIVKNQDKNKNQQTPQVAENKTYGTEIRIGISAMDTFDPIVSTNKNVQDVCKLVYEPLITVDSNFKAEGVLAEEWAKLDNNVYLIKLKHGVKWHNGNDFTAKDVEFTINKIKQDGVNSIYKSNVQNIANVTVVDNYTLNLKLTQPESFFEYNLIFPIEQASDYVSSIPIPSGTGMYKIYQMDNAKIELARNPYKENIEEVQIKTIIIKNYATIGELYNDFKIGNVDILNTNNLNYTKYIGTFGYTSKTFHGRNYNFLSLNTANVALYNIEVRRAISYAIDKNAIIANIYNNKYYLANYMLDYGTWLYSDELTSSGYNPEQSEKILRDNGWQYVDGVWQKNINNTVVKLSFNLIVNSTDTARIQVAESIKQQLANVGIQINIVQVPSIVSYIESKNYDIALVELGMGVSPDLTMFFGDNNIANYNNQKTATIIKEIRETEDENVLKEKYNNLLEIYKVDIPYISLYFDSSTLIYNSKIVGNINPTWYNLYYNIEKWKIEQ